MTNRFWGELRSSLNGQCDHEAVLRLIERWPKKTQHQLAEYLQPYAYIFTGQHHLTFALLKLWYRAKALDVLDVWIDVDEPIRDQLSTKQAWEDLRWFEQQINRNQFVPGINFVECEQFESLIEWLDLKVRYFEGWYTPLLCDENITEVQVPYRYSSGEGWPPIVDFHLVLSTGGLAMDFEGDWYWPCKFMVKHTMWQWLGILEWCWRAHQHGAGVPTMKIWATQVSEYIDDSSFVDGAVMRFDRMWRLYLTLRQEVALLFWLRLVL